MHRIAEIIVAYLEKESIIENSFDDRCIYIYGFETGIYTLFSTLLLLFFGLTFGRLRETFILISVFYLNQTIGGGYHADTHWGCISIMLLGLVAYIIFHSYLPSKAFLIIICISSIIVLFLCPLVLHKNKEYLRKYSGSLISRSHLIVFFEAVFGIVLLTHDYPDFRSYTYAISISALSRFVAYLMQ